MDSIGIPEDAIAEATGRSLSAVGRALNPQFRERCAPYRKTKFANGDETDNFLSGETLMDEGTTQFFADAYCVEREIRVYRWRADAFLSAAVILSGLDFQKPTGIEEILQSSPVLGFGYRKACQKYVSARKSLSAMGLELGLGLDGIAACLREGDRGDLLYEFAFLNDFLLKDSQWSIGIREDEPQSDWITRGKWYAKVTPK